MSRLPKNRAWFVGATLVAVLGFAACSDDEDDTAGTAGTGGGPAGQGGMPPGGEGGEGTAMGGTRAGMSGSSGAAGEGRGGDEAGGGGGDGGAAGSHAGQGGEGNIDDSVRAELAGMSPLPALPVDTTNMYADSAAAAAFGQRLFFDEKFSGPLKIASDLGGVGATQKISCKSCHGTPVVLDDDRSNPDTVSIGADVHTRNSPALTNSAFYTWTNWGGRFASQWELPLAVVESGVIMNGNRLALAHRIFDVYKADYEGVFGAGSLLAEIGSDAERFPPAGKPKASAVDPDGDWEKMAAGDRTIVNRILVNYSKAIQAYLRKLVNRTSPFDAFMAGDDDAISASAKRGALLFSNLGCRNCHDGPTFSDQGFHDLGGPQTGPNVPATDDGRFVDAARLSASTMNIDSDFSDDKTTGKLAGLATIPDSWKGAFRTSSLRGVAASAPYMHSGQLATLSDVIDFYAQGPNANARAGEALVPFTISADEKAELIAFLETLTSGPVAAALLVDTAAP